MNFLSRLFSFFYQQLVPNEIQDPAVNKNIEALKKIQNSETWSKEVYKILQRIINQKDFDAMQFIIKEEYKAKRFSQVIFERSIIQGQFQFARFIMEIDGNIHLPQKLIVIDGNPYMPWYIVQRMSSNIGFVKFIIKSQYFNIYQFLFSACRNGYLEVVKLFLTVHDIDINATDCEYKNTALICASSCGQYEVVKLILGVFGINVNAKDCYNGTALINASEKGYYEIVKLLLTVPQIDVNARDCYNRTALIWASEKGYSEIVKLLLIVPGIDTNMTYSDSDELWLYN